MQKEQVVTTNYTSIVLVQVLCIYSVLMDWSVAFDGLPFEDRLKQLTQEFKRGTNDICW